MSELPDGWTRVVLRDVLTLVNGFPFKPSQWQTEGLPIIRIQNLNNPGASFNYCDDTLPEGFRVKRDDLLFAWSGTPGTSFGCHVWSGGDAWLNQHIFRVEFDRGLFDRTFLKHAINQNLDDYIAQAHGGAGLAHITKGKFEGSMLILPPLNEQRRIVAKLEELLAKVEDCQKRLAKVPMILKRFRQSVLAAACSGQLTRELVASGKSTPWMETTLNAIASEIRTGPFGTALHKSDYIDGGVPVVNPTHIVSGRIVPSGRTSVSNSTYQRLADYALQEGDIVIARRGEMGRCAVVTSSEAGWLCGTGSAILRLDKTAVPQFLQLLISSPSIRSYLSDGSVGSTMDNLNQRLFGAMPILLPNIVEQREIVRRVEALFRFADQIEARYKKAQAQVDNVTQSILAKAFRGELVPTEAELARRKGRAGSH